MITTSTLLEAIKSREVDVPGCADGVVANSAEVSGQRGDEEVVADNMGEEEESSTIKADA